MKYYRKYKDACDASTYQPDLKLWVNNAQVKKLILQYPDALVSELCWHYNETTDKKISTREMSRVIRNLELKQKRTDKEKIKTLAAQHPGISIVELHKRYNDEANKKISLCTMYRIAQNLKIEYKKSRSQKNFSWKL